MDCPQDIPCNPCVGLCPGGAIKMIQGFTDLPVVDEEKCTGCGLCVAMCPGQACFVIDMEYDTTRQWASIDIPWEGNADLQEKTFVVAVDNEGAEQGKVVVECISDIKIFDKTRIITLVGETDIIRKTRGWKMEKKEIK